MLWNANDESASSGEPASTSREAYDASAGHHELDRQTVSGERSGLGGGSASAASSPGPINPMLRKLLADLGGDQVVFERFVCDFLALLDIRVETIRADLRTDDDDATVVGLLSLETTSVMLGADGVASAAHALRSAVERREWDRCAALVSIVLTETEALRAELEREGFRASS